MGQPGDSEVPGVSRRTEYMRDYRDRKGAAAREAANRTRRQRQKAIDQLIFRHQGEFDTILAEVRRTWTDPK